MKLALDVSDNQKRYDVLQLAKRLNIPVEILEMTEGEEDQSLLSAMEEGRKEGIATKEEQEEFMRWLKQL